VWRSRAELALLATLALAAAPSAAGGGLERLQRLADTFRTRPAWHARYEQRYVPAGFAEGETARGEVWVGWPDRALWATGEPPVRWLGAAGRRVRLVDLEVGSCEERTLGAAEWARLPLTAVVDPGRAVERFTILEEGGTVVLVPRTPGDIARVELVVGGDGLPAVVTLHDAAGAVNRIRFLGWAPVAPPASWLPEPPPGVRCADADPPRPG